MIDLMVFIRNNIYIDTRTHTHIHIHIYVYIYVYMYVYIYICMYVCIYIYKYYNDSCLSIMLPRALCYVSTLKHESL
jgi:hypothetical protein